MTQHRKERLQRLATLLGETLACAGIFATCWLLLLIGYAVQ